MVIEKSKPTPNPSRLREGSDTARDANPVPLPQAGGVRGGPVDQVRPFKPRDTKRAKDLRHSATPAERLLWTYLSKSQLGAKFSRQMPVGKFFADFLCREKRLIIELDGFSHDVQPRRDVWRDELLRKAGFQVLHFNNEEVLSNAEGVAQAIKLALASIPTPNPSRLREGS